MIKDPFTLWESFSTIFLCRKECGISLNPEESSDVAMIDHMMKPVDRTKPKWINKEIHRHYVAKMLADSRKMLNTDDLDRRGG